MEGFPGKYLHTLGGLLLRSGVRIPRFYALDHFYHAQRLLDTLRALNVNCILDVGANKGTFSRALRKLGYSGLILSFEPVKEDFERIRLLSRGDALWRSFNVAIGDVESESSFNVIHTGVDDTVFSSFLDVKDLPTENIEKRKIRIKRLDAVLREEAVAPEELRIFLKSDTQGYDLHVVKSAGEFLPCVLALQCEVSVIPIYQNVVHYTEAITFLKSFGYSLLDLFVVNRAPDGCVREYDCLMIRNTECMK